MSCMNFEEIDDNFVLKHFAKEHDDILAFKKNAALMQNNGFGLFMNFSSDIPTPNLQTLTLPFLGFNFLDIPQ